MLGLRVGNPFRVARAFRALVSAFRRNELPSTCVSEPAADLGFVRRGKSVAAERGDQRAECARYPILAALLLLALTAHAADWPMHRGGPQLQGLAAMTAPAKPELAWTFAAGKPIKGAAAIVGGRVFFGDDEGLVHALDLASGKEIWKFKTESSIEASPLVLDGVVFIGSSDSNLYALDATKGSLKWKYTTGDKILGGASFAKNPAGTGTWILVGSYDSSLHCVDAATGKAVWTHATDNYINGTPALLPSGEIVFGGCDAMIHVLQLSDGKELRQFESGAYIASSAAIFDGLGYVGNYGNEVLGFDPKGGAVTWKFRARNFPYFSSAAVTKEHVLIGGRDKQLHCLDRSSGKQTWAFPTRGDVDSSPVICGDAVIFGSADGRLYCVEIGTGKERWAYEIGAPVIASPAAADGRIVIGAEDGNVYCFGPSAHVADGCPRCLAQARRTARLGYNPEILKSIILENSEPLPDPAAANAP